MTLRVRHLLLGAVVALAPIAAARVPARAAHASGIAATTPPLAYTSFVNPRMDDQPRTVDRVPDLFVMGSDGRRTRRLTRTLAWESDPAWSRDGARIAYASGIPDTHAGSIGAPMESAIWIAHQDGTRAQALVPVDWERPRINDAPAWSPRGDRIAFSRTAIGDPDAVDGIYVVDVRSRGVRLLVRGAGRSDWSPDGRTIAVVDATWVSALSGRAPALRLVDVATGRVTAGPRLPKLLISDLEYSPDGRQLALAGNDGVLVVRLATGQVTRLARAKSVASVSWSPDGRRLAFTASDVFVVGTDGRRLRRLRLTGSQGGVDWRP